MQKLICLVGPTGVGKTKLAFHLANRFNGALISADSVQVFKGLDVISGKDIPSDASYKNLPEIKKNGYHSGFYTYNNVPIFLLDVVDPTSDFSVSQFQELAVKVIDYIAKKDMVPIVVGGTGLYVHSLLENIETTQIKPNTKLRNELESLKVEELQEKLQKLDFQKYSLMNRSDSHNKRRLVRAIEILSVKQKRKRINSHEYESLVVGLTCKKDVLKKKIDKRVDHRLKNGALDEVGKLYRDYDVLSQQVKDANGYKQLFSYLKGEVDFEEAIFRWKIAEYHHAKNQTTWFRKYGNVKWFDIENESFEKEVEEEIINFLNKNKLL